MYNKLVLTITLIILMAMSAAARTVKYVELGVNRSSFHNESCTPGYGMSGGLGIDYYPQPNFGGFAGLGFVLNNKKMVLKDRIWEISMDQMDYYFSKGDIDINLLFLDVPFRVGYTIKITQQFSLSFFGGYSFTFPLSNHNKIKNLQLIKLKKNENGEYDFDYERVDEGTLETYEKMLYGVSVMYQKFMLSISIENALGAAKISEGIYIKDENDEFKFMIAYFFNIKL